MTEAVAVPELVSALERVARRARVQRKLVVAPTIGAGRELLRCLSAAGTGWIGFEVSTPGRLAARLARPELEKAGLRTMDAFDQQALLDEALDRALLAEGKGLGELSEGVGFRERVQGAVSAMRLSGIGPKELDRARLADWSKRLFLLRVLQGYERLLNGRKLADPASVLRLALTALEAEGNQLPASLGADQLLLVPGLSTRGLGGRFLTELQSRGAKVLETDPVVGLDAPPTVLWTKCERAGPYAHLHAPDHEDSAPGRLDFFRAASITEELREVVRRIVERGLRWDEVEIVTPDPSSYGSAMHALSSRLGIPVTYAVGLPVERTRPGRVVRAYLDWIEEGFQADPIRRLLEAGDLKPKRTKMYHPPAALARRFRSLRIGWGRKRYRTQLREALAAADERSYDGWGTEESFQKRRDRELGELTALRSLLFPALKATPTVPDRMGEGGVPVSPAQLARGLRAFLRRVHRGDGADRQAREALGRVLERIEATLTRRTEFRAAVTILRRHLSIRVRAPQAGAPPDDPGAPWSSEGGHVHLSDLAHGGYTGRKMVFIVGADSERLPGPGVQDPVLLDGDRRVLGAGLPTSSELLREQLFDFAALVARLRGELTLSYSAWDASEARSVGPSPVLVQALRLSRRDAGLTFEDLHDTLGRVVCPIPALGRPALDRDDVWMSVLGGGPVMKFGTGLVRAAFGPLDRGLRTEEARDGVPGPMHGVVEPRPQELDPRRNEALVLSASRLEDLGSCPLRYLHKSVLRLYPPDDPELDPERWLDPRAKGSLLHAVFERSLREAGEGGVKHEEPRFEELALGILREEVTVLRRRVPIPGEGALRRERAGLEEDVRSFVRMIRETGAPWIKLELKFGIGQDEPVRLELPGGDLRMRGAVDRIDADLEGLHVIDYKTGVAWGFRGETGAFNGGRRLQHALYAYAVDARVDGQVATGAYHYPTRRGENQRFVFQRDALKPVTDLVDGMLDMVAAGTFVPTERKDDCKFCDYADICRVEKGDFGAMDAPLSDWSLEQFNSGLHPAFHPLKKVRAFED